MKVLILLLALSGVAPLVLAQGGEFEIQNLLVLLFILHCRIVNVRISC